MKRATLALIVQNDHVLLGYKKKGEIGTGTLNGPGGKCESGESLLDCVCRETTEEVAVTLVPERLRKIAVITFCNGEVPDFEVHVFWTDYYEGEPYETDDMIPNWYSIHALPFAQMLESDRAWFGKAVAREEFTARVFYQTRAAGFMRIEFD